MASSSQLLPEFFALLGIDLFLALSLLTCLLDNRFPKAISYIYQIAALAGFGHVLVSRDFFFGYGEYTRFWYCFFYLVVALANVVGLNVYLAVVKGQYSVAKIWSGAVTFPSILVSVFFVAQYGWMQSTMFPLFLQISLLVAVSVMGIGVSVLLTPEIAHRLFGRAKEVK